MRYNKEPSPDTYRQQSQGRRKDENELKWALRCGWKKLEKDCPLIPKEDFQFILLRLEKSGLIGELPAGWLGEGGIFVITDVFRKIMKYLEQN